MVDRPNTAGTPHLPNELLCPITLEVMSDPVMQQMVIHMRGPLSNTGTGQGDDVRSPVTGLVLSSRLLTPNVTIRSMCLHYSNEGL